MFPREGFVRNRSCFVGFGHQTLWEDALRVAEVYGGVNASKQVSRPRRDL